MKKLTALAYIIMSLVFAALGVAGGWHLSNRTGGGHADAPADHDDHADHEDDEHEGHTDGLLVFSPQALANMGVTVAELEEGAFAVTENIPATVVETPQTEQPVVAPVSGVVQTVTPRLGQRVAAGDVVVTILRDALPRPELGLTEGMLQPATEEYHATKSALRQALKGRELLAREIARLESLGTAQGSDLPLIPRQELITLGYELEKLDLEAENARRELRLHGLTDAQVATIAAGEEPDLNLSIWRGVLQRNGFWNAEAEQLMELMPAETRAHPWLIATLGEMVMQDLLSAELLAWMAADAVARRHVLAVAAMLMEGQSLVAIRRLAAAGALEAEVRVTIPAAAADWDLHDLHVKPGDHVDTGQVLLTLANPRDVYLDAFPVGSEVTAMRTALLQQAPINATPLVAGSGPTLTDLRLQRMAGGEDDRPLARILLRNTLLAETEADGAHYRSWALRPGLRYLLHVPIRQLDDVLVVPAAAVVDNGADKVVYIQNGAGFLPRRVELLHADHEHAVLGPRSELFPGDPVVVSGAFAINLAQRAASGAGADPHAGHNH